MFLEVSNNSMSIFRGCQKKYYWSYIEGLKPVRKSSALTLGTLLHEAFEKYYNGSTDVLKYITTVMDDRISIAPPEEIEDLTIIKYTVLGLWTYHPFKLSDFKEVKPELEFRVKVPGCRGIDLVGKIDGLVTDLNDRLWIRELKTTSQAFSQFEVRSRQSQQGTAYIYALRKLGYPVEGILYDFCKKPLLRKGVNESMDQYGQRIMYDPGNRPDVYFKRHPSYRTNEEILMFENDMRQVALDIRKRTHDGKWHRNTDQCWNYNSECPYLKICFKNPPDPMTIQVYFDRKPTVNKGGTNVGNTGSTGGCSTGSGSGRATDSQPVGHGVDIGRTEAVD